MADELCSRQWAGPVLPRQLTESQTSSQPRAAFGPRLLDAADSADASAGQILHPADALHRDPGAGESLGRLPAGAQCNEADDWFQEEPEQEEPEDEDRDPSCDQDEVAAFLQGSDLADADADTRAVL